MIVTATNGAPAPVAPLKKPPTPRAITIVSSTIGSIVSNAFPYSACGRQIDSSRRTKRKVVPETGMYLLNRMKRFKCAPSNDKA